MGEIKEAKNQEQSNKSKHGNAFNFEMHNRHICKAAENELYLFIISETKYIKRRCGEHLSSVRCQIDQFVALVNERKKQIKLIFIDNTTSARDRTTGKVNNARKVDCFKNEIISDFINLYPKFAGYEISFEVGNIYPDFIDNGYKNPESERVKINLDCAIINYGTGTYHNDDKYLGLDFGFRAEEYFSCIDYLLEHQEIDFITTGIKDVWKILYNSPDKKPPIYIDRNAIKNQGERVKYCLKVYSKRYEIEELRRVLEDMGIQTPKSVSKKICISKILKLIENQNL